MTDVREKLVELRKEAAHQAICTCSAFRNCEDCTYRKYGTDCRDNIEMDYLLKNGVTVQEWISVKDGLPREGEDVLVFGYWHEKFQPLMCYLSPHRKGEWFTTVAGQQVYEVTHWMPLPEPPVGDSPC